MYSIGIIVEKNYGYIVPKYAPIMIVTQYFFFQSSCVMIREINNLNFRQLRYSSCMKTNSLDIKNNVG